MNEINKPNESQADTEVFKSLPDRWAPFLSDKPETGMGYWIVTAKLRNGTLYKQVVIDGGLVVRVKGFKKVPFNPADIVDLEVTHDKWNWNEAA